MNATIHNIRAKAGVLCGSFLSLTLLVAPAVNAAPELPTDGLVLHLEADSGVTVTDMTTDVVTLSEEQELLLAEEVMKLMRIRHIPVMRDGRVVGIVTARDLF